MNEPIKRVVVHVLGGIVQDVDCPPGVEVVVQDYDTENYKEEQLDHDLDDQCATSIWGCAEERWQPTLVEGMACAFCGDPLIAAPVWVEREACCDQECADGLVAFSANEIPKMMRDIMAESNRMENLP